MRILTLGSTLKIRNLQRHFAGEQQRGDRALEFVSQSLLYFLPHQQDFLLVPMQSGAQFARDPVHAVDGEVHVHRNGRPNMFQHHVAFDRLGFEECLIDENGDIFPGAKLGQRLRRESQPHEFLRR